MTARRRSKKSSARRQREVWRRRALGTTGVALGVLGAWWVLDVPGVWMDSVGLPVQSVELTPGEPPVELGGIAGLPSGAKAPTRSAAGAGSNSRTRPSRDRPAYGSVVAPPPKPASVRRARVQVSASSRRDWAEDLARRLTGQGFDSQVVDDATDPSAIRFKVRVRGGPGESADALIRRLRSRGHSAWQVPR